MLKDKHVCVGKEVGDELLSCRLACKIPSGFLLLGGGLQVDPSLSSSPFSLCSPHHAAPVLVAMVTRGEPIRATEGCRQENGERGREGERDGREKGLEGSTLPFP